MIVEHLVSRGLARSADGVTVEPLQEGVFAVVGPGLDVVVKTGASAVEERALRLVRTLVPGTVPPVLDLHSGYLVLRRAPGDWVNEADNLASEVVDIEVARRVGWMLGRLQRRTAADPEATRQFADRSAFDKRRLDPVHRAVRGRYPELAEAVDTTLTVMAQTSACLVHGALGPRNLLVSPPPGPGITLGARRLWVLDWDTVHVGDPTVDPAFALSSALVGTVYQPELASRYAAGAQAFLHALAGERAELPPLDPDQLGRQVGVLLVAAAEKRAGAQELLDLGRTLLLDPPAGITDAWKRLS